jgi:subtilisin family serine protease
MSNLRRSLRRSLCPRRRQPYCRRPARHWSAAALPVVVLVWMLSIAGCGDVEPPVNTAPQLAPYNAPADVGDAKSAFTGSPGMVPGQLVVKLASGVHPSTINATLGTRTLATIESIDLHLLELPAQAPPDKITQALAHLPGVEWVEGNLRLQTPETEQRSLPFDDGSLTADDFLDQEFMSRIGASDAHAITTGNGVLIACLDTGIDSDHQQLADHIAPGGYDFTDDDDDPEDEKDGIDQDGDGLIDEGTGHGTHVAGLVLLAAPDARILPVRVLDTEGWGTVFGLVQGIEHAVAAGAQVINLSLGLDSRSIELHAAIQLAEQSGCVVETSAGNRGRNAPYHYPAGYPETIAITATDKYDTLADFSNFGPHIDLCAPGVGIISTFVSGGFAVWSGTSMSTPLVSGGAALLLSVQPAGAGEVRDALYDGADDVGTANPGQAQLVGGGRLNLHGALLEY